jgi:hypothetical protein
LRDAGNADQETARIKRPRARRTQA